MKQSCQRLLMLVILGSLSACTGLYNDWTPIVDTDNDPNADRLKYDMAQCRQLALRAGEQEVNVENGNILAFSSPDDYRTDNFDSVSIKAYRYAFISCLKQRQHPVLTRMPPP